MSSLLKESLRDLLPQIFQRQYFFVFPTESLYMAGICLIPAIEVFIDGVLVIDERIPVGKIGSKNILSAYRTNPDSLYDEVRSVMQEVGDLIEVDASLDDVIKVFKDTKFGFTPIIKDQSVAGVISLRDILPLIARSRIENSVITIASPAISERKDISISDAIELMLDKSVRRLIINDEDESYVLSDREVLGFLMWNEFGRKDKKDILSMSIENLRMKPVTRIKDQSISAAAELLMNQSAPASLLLGNFIITPWDVVMKTLASNE